MRVDEAKKMDVWDENNIWYLPNQEFAHWFQAKGLQIADIDSFIRVDSGDDIEETNINGLSPNSKWNEVTICIEPTLKSDIPIFVLLHQTIMNVAILANSDLPIRISLIVQTSYLKLYKHLQS